MEIVRYKYHGLAGNQGERLWLSKTAEAYRVLVTILVTFFGNYYVEIHVYAGTCGFPQSRPSANDRRKLLSYQFVVCPRLDLLIF